MPHRILVPFSSVASKSSVSMPCTFVWNVTEVMGEEILPCGKGGSVPQYINAEKRASTSVSNSMPSPPVQLVGGVNSRSSFFLFTSTIVHQENGASNEVRYREETDTFTLSRSSSFLCETVFAHKRRSATNHCFCNQKRTAIQGSSFLEA